MVYIVYKTTNLINNKIYVGVHKTQNPDEFDGYIGCGVNINRPSSVILNTNSIFPKAVSKYGFHNFKRETLFIYPCTELGYYDAYNKEKEIVNHEFISRDDTYNIEIGGFGANSANLKKVRQYSLDGTYILTWNSLAEASMYTNAVKISEVCKLKRNTSGGFQWRYDSDNIDKLPKIDLQRKTVYLFLLNGEFIKPWESIYEASKQFPNPDSANAAIKRNCEGLCKSAKGFFWSYKRRFAYFVNTNKTPVACYLFDGTFVLSFDNIYDACAYFNMKDHSGILASIYGKHKYCNNLRWRFFYGNTGNIKPT